MSLIDNLEADGFDLKTLLDPKASQEVARVMQICNACRYCEGFLCCLSSDDTPPPF